MNVLTYAVRSSMLMAERIKIRLSTPDMSVTRTFEDINK